MFLYHQMSLPVMNPPPMTRTGPKSEGEVEDKRDNIV